MFDLPRKKEKKEISLQVNKIQFELHKSLWR